MKSAVLRGPLPHRPLTPLKLILLTWLHSSTPYSLSSHKYPFTLLPTYQALHYKELEFQTSPLTAVEALIHINNQLRQPEAAVWGRVWVGSGVGVTFLFRFICLFLFLPTPAPTLLSLHTLAQQVGILTYAQKHLHMELKEGWYEKLCRWDDALEAYTKRWVVGDLFQVWGSSPGLVTYTKKCGGLKCGIVEVIVEVTVELTCGHGPDSMCCH